jgi:hypothetical protein
MIGVITNLPGLPHKLEAPWATPSRLGFQEPKSNKRKSNRLDEEIKCSSFETIFLSRNPFSQLKLLQDLKLGAKRRGEGELES